MTTDRIHDQGEQRDEPRVDGASGSLGQTLGEAAAHQGLTAADLAGMLNLDLRTVQAIFEDRLQDTPGPMYIRAYIKSWAPALGLDADQILHRHADVLGGERPRETVRRETRPTLAVMEQERVSSRWFVWVFWLIVLAIIALVGWQLLPSGLLGKAPDGHSAILESPDDALSPRGADSVDPLPPPPRVDRENEPVSLPVLPAIDEPAPRPARPESEETAAQPAGAPQVVSSDDESAPTPQAQEQAAAPEPAEDRVVEIATEGGESWVELADARGDRLMFGTLGRGESRQFEGQPPFELVLGNPGVVSVTYRGETLDVTPRGGRSTTRLTFGEAP